MLSLLDYIEEMYEIANTRENLGVRSSSSARPVIKGTTINPKHPNVGTYYPDRSVYYPSFGSKHHTKRV